MWWKAILGWDDEVKPLPTMEAEPQRKDYETDEGYEAALGAWDRTEQRPPDYPKWGFNKATAGALFVLAFVAFIIYFDL